MSVKGLWTKAELAEARRLAEACEANDAHWEFADWLLAKEPVSGGDRNGSYARLAALGAELGLSRGRLTAIRHTAHAWPPQSRVSNASFRAHSILTRGGPYAARTRGAELASRPRNRYGKLRTTGVGSGPNSTTLNVDFETYAAVVAEAAANDAGIGATAATLITEALEARAWLADDDAIGMRVAA